MHWNVVLFCFTGRWWTRYHSAVWGGSMGINALAVGMRVWLHMRWNMGSVAVPGCMHCWCMMIMHIVVLDIWVRLVHRLVNMTMRLVHGQIRRKPSAPGSRRVYGS